MASNQKLRQRKGHKGEAWQVKLEGDVTHATANKSSALVDSSYAPGLRPVVLMFCALRLLSAIVNIISDCDETFNYWEPLHYLLYGFGLQTWEYSPTYALRSYTYLSLMAAVGKAAELVNGGNKVAVFFFLRGLLGILCALGEGLFYRAVLHRFGKSVARYTLAFLAVNAGMFLASTAFLPSSFCMYLTMFVYYFWLRSQYHTAVFLGVLAVLLGWPFVGLLFLPLAIDCFTHRGIILSLYYGISSVLIILAPSTAIEYYFYGKPVVPALNIVLYNVFGGGGGAGSTLYGVEPASFYLKNLLLNHNLSLILALGAVAAMCIDFLLRSNKPQAFHVFRFLLFLSPMYLWFIFMMAQPHKEERFMYPIYPLFCLAAAISLRVVVHWGTAVVHMVTRSQKMASIMSRQIVLGTFLLSFLLSMSRVISIVTNYQAPIKVYAHLYYQELGSYTPLANAEKKESAVPYEELPEINVCVGKEWYRFPSSFFLPSEKVHLKFIKSSFGGQLPQPFAKTNGTSVVLPNFNDLNREETSRYYCLTCTNSLDLLFNKLREKLPASAIRRGLCLCRDPRLNISVQDCDYLVDFEQRDQKEQSLTQSKDWEVVKQESFLNAGLSPSLLRAFYVPKYTPQAVVYDKYVLLKRRQPQRKTGWLT